LQGISLGTIDIGIIIVYVIGTIFLGYWVGRGKTDSEGYFLAGRNLTWPLIGLSLYASNMSGSSFVGLAAGGYTTGVAIYHYEYMAAIALIIALFFILPFYLREKIYTIPEFLERRFDRRSRFTFAGLNVLLILFLDLSGTLYAAGVVAQTIWPDVPLWSSIATMAVIAGIYTIFGGLSAVVITDAIQSSILIVGGIIVSLVAFLQIGSWSEVVQATPPEALSMIRPPSDETLPWTGLFGVLIVGFYFWVTNQLIVQRTLGAKDIHHGRWGALFGGFLKVPALFIFILPGLFARVLYPDLENPDRAFPLLAFDMLPVGVRGVIGAALIAAAMSTIDSALNSASTLISMDFVRTTRPKTTDEQLSRLGKIITGVLMVSAAIWAPQIASFESIWSYFQSILSYVTPPVVAVFLAGIFWPKANRHAAFWTLAIGIAVGFVAFLLVEIAQLVAWQFLVVCTGLFLFNLAMVVGLTFTIGQADKREETSEETGLTWDTGYWIEESRDLKQVNWYQNYRVLSAILVLLALGVVVMFW
jgi:SSS family solute:Na+ symporter